jgi:isopentenyldiphosphate isomerase
MDPTEVANVQWIEAEALGLQLIKKPGYFAPWLLAHLSQLEGPTGLEGA